MRDEGMWNRMVEGCEGNAFSSVKCDCLRKQRELFLHAKPKTVLHSTRCFSTLLVPFWIHVFFCFPFTKQGWNLNLLRTVSRCLFYTGREERSPANRTHHNWTFSLLHDHTLCVHHHHALLVIIVQLFKLSTPPLFSAHLFACICARPASLTLFLLPNISPFSKLLHFPASSPLAQSSPSSIN